MVSIQKAPNHKCGNVLTLKSEPKVNNSKYLYYTDDRLQEENLSNDSWKIILATPRVTDQYLVNIKWFLWESV